MLTLYTYTSLSFFTDHPTTKIYTLSLHDALPISEKVIHDDALGRADDAVGRRQIIPGQRFGIGIDEASLAVEPLTFFGDRKSTRLNSSHTVISYAVFCLKKKKK